MKNKYFYNPQTLRYEEVKTSLRMKILMWVGVMLILIATVFLVTSISFYFFPTVKEKILIERQVLLEKQYSPLNKKVEEMNHLMQEIEKRDNQVYRIIFGADPIPDENRQQFINSQVEEEEVAKMSNNEMLIDLTKNLYTLEARVKVQGESFDQLSSLLKNQAQRLNSIPAIQPISNLQLNRISSGFGRRTDPIYKVMKSHEGIDFSAPMGTPIYATANGVVSESGDTKNGYGIHVVINHGFGYKTLYGHMMKTNVKVGKSVKRGQVIGWVGNTGKSTAPHCHYEVRVNNQPVDPINYFYNDLTPAQYEYLLKAAASSTQSMD